MYHAAHFEAITTKEVLNEFLNIANDYVHQVTWLLVEKFHDLGLLKPSVRIYTVLKTWFQTTSTIAQPGMASTQDLLRLITTYYLATKGWTPPSRP